MWLKQVKEINEERSNLDRQSAAIRKLRAYVNLNTLSSEKTCDHVFDYKLNWNRR